MRAEDFKLMLLCVQAVTAKDVQNLEKQERKEQLSGYKQCCMHIQKSKLRSVQIYEFGSLRAPNLILEAKPPPTSQSCLRP